MTNTQAAPSTSTPTAASAAWTLASFAFAGVVASLIGGIIAARTWPHTTVDGFGLYASPVQHGSTGGAVAGLIVAGIGGVLIQIAIIGWGVLWGVRAAGK